MYIAGELDRKYREVMELAASSGAATHVVNGVGHAMVSERPEEVAKVLTDWVLAEGPSRSVQSDAEFSIRELSFEQYKLEASDPEEVFAKADLSSRPAFDVILTSASSVRGIGEAAPLKRLHRETGAEVVEALVKIKDGLVRSGGSQVTAQPSSILDLNSGVLATFVQSLASKGEVDLDAVPSVRAALEEAVLMVAAETLAIGVGEAVASRSGGTLRSSLRLNSVVSQKDDSIATGARDVDVVKVKVRSGGNVEEEGLRVSRIAKKHEGTRLDANGQLEWNEAIDIGKVINATCKNIEYVEEPVNFDDSICLAERVELLAKWASETGLEYALDESLTTKAGLAGVENLDGCGAVILKPSLIGFQNSWNIAQRSKELGIKVVVTSCFDGPVGLAHLAWFASMVNGDGVHGLSTFDRFFNHPRIAGFLSGEGVVKDSGGVDGISLSPAGACRWLHKKLNSVHKM